MKRFGKSLMRTVRESDWFDWLYLSAMVFFGGIAAVVVDELQKEFGG